MYLKKFNRRCRLVLKAVFLIVIFMAFEINAQEITSKTGLIEQKPGSARAGRVSEMQFGATMQIDTSAKIEPPSSLEELASAPAPILISPPEGAVLDNGRTDFLDVIVWDFDWSEVAEATQYNLYVIHSGASFPIINIAVSASSYHFVSVGYIIDANRFGWTWKVRAMVNGVWEPFSAIRTFDVEPVNTDPPSTVAGPVLRVPAEFPTIQHALDAAAGDTVLVAQGIYRERLTITRKIVLLSESGAVRTVINSTGWGNNKQSWVINVFANCTISGFTLTSSDLYTFGIDCNTFSPTIENNIIENVKYSGIFCKQSSPIIRRNLIKGCQQCGIIMNTNATPHIIHNTIVANRTGIAAYVYSKPFVVNNIVVQNTFCGLLVETGAGMTNWCNDIWGSNSNYFGNVRRGKGEISADPLFVGGNPFDYHLRANSPCIDAGDPAASKDPDKTRADLGAYPFDIRTDVAAQNLTSLPTALLLEQNYPNPFNPETRIQFWLPKASLVVLKIYDIMGREIRTLAKKHYETGYHHVTWDGHDKQGNSVPSGTYYYRFIVGEFQQARKMLLLR